MADLTNERPDVYLEVGFTMGVDKGRPHLFDRMLKRLLGRIPNCLRFK